MEPHVANRMTTPIKDQMVTRVDDQRRHVLKINSARVNDLLVQHVDENIVPHWRHVNSHISAISTPREHNINIHVIVTGQFLRIRIFYLHIYV